MTAESLKQKIDQLPPELQKEVEDYVQLLIERQKSSHKGQPQFQWAGALKDLRDKYTSVELQHKASEWRVED